MYTNSRCVRNVIISPNLNAIFQEQPIKTLLILLASDIPYYFIKNKKFGAQMENDSKIT